MREAELSAIKGCIEGWTYSLNRAVIEPQIIVLHSLRIHFS